MMYLASMLSTDVVVPVGHLEKNQGRRQIRRGYLQEDVPNWGKFTKTIWATQNIRKTTP